VNLAVGAVAAALVAALAVLAFCSLRTLSSLRALKVALDRFRTEAEPLARHVLEVAEEAAARAQSVPRSVEAIKTAIHR
jgi:hypothetical protein